MGARNFCLCEMTHCGFAVIDSKTVYVSTFFTLLATAHVTRTLIKTVTNKPLAMH
jgi:hypothetical protein